MALDINKINELRTGKGWTQTEAAKRSGVRGGAARWSDIESGRRANVTVKTLERIAKALGVGARDLLK